MRAVLGQHAAAGVMSPVRVGIAVACETPRKPGLTLG